MTARRRRAEDVYWNLSSLVGDYVLELPASRRSADALRSGLQPRTRICVPARGRSLPDVLAETAQIAAAGMRPVVICRAPVAGPRAFDQAVAALAQVGARELTIRWPSSASPIDVLKGAARLVAECGLGSWGISELGIVSESLAGHNPEPSAELLRAFEGVRAAGNRYDIGFTLSAPPAHSIESVVAWECALRAAGSRLPVRVRLHGIAPNPFRSTVPMLLGLAAAVESDPRSLLTELQFSLRGSPGRTTAFADEICRGNFVVEETVSGYRLSLLAARGG